jgi:hypothetical protein
MKKIHIAGPVICGEQKCTRCHARIEPLKAGSYWPEGALVLSDGRGNMRVVEQSEERPCGSKGAK